MNSPCGRGNRVEKSSILFSSCLLSGTITSTYADPLCTLKQVPLEISFHARVSLSFLPCFSHSVLFSRGMKRNKNREYINVNFKLRKAVTRKNIKNIFCGWNVFRLTLVYINNKSKNWLVFHKSKKKESQNNFKETQNVNIHLFISFNTVICSYGQK